MGGLNKSLALLLTAACLGATASAFTTSAASAKWYAQYCNHGLEMASANAQASNHKLPC